MSFILNVAKLIKYMNSIYLTFKIFKLIYKNFNVLMYPKCGINIF